MYTIVKVGSVYKVLLDSNVVQFSSLQRKHCKQWVLEVSRSHEEHENSFCEQVV